MSCRDHNKHLAGCEECRATARHYFMRRKEAMRAGTWLPPVPIREVQPHVRRLLRARMTIQQIADAAHIGYGTVAAISAGPKSRRRGLIHGPNAAAVLAVPVPTERAAPKGWVNAAGTCRRVRALCRSNYTLKSQAGELAAMAAADGGPALCVETLRRLTRDQPWVRPGTEQQVAALYERLTSRPAPTRRTAIVKFAVRRGWDGPDAWDAETIDDPRAKPFDHLREPGKPPKDTVSVAAVWVALAGGGALDELTVAERREVVTILANRGWSDDRIGTYLRTAGRNITAFRTRHGIASHYDQALDQAERRQLIAAAEAA